MWYLICCLLGGVVVVFCSFAFSWFGLSVGWLAVLDVFAVCGYWLLYVLIVALVLRGVPFCVIGV